MKKLTRFLLKKYAKMPGEKKVSLGMSLSQTVRDVRKFGAIKMGA